MNSLSLTACVTGSWAGLDNAMIAVIPKVRINSIYWGESHESGARFVGWLYELPALANGQYASIEALEPAVTA